jgi:hypothetical protein
LKPNKRKQKYVTNRIQFKNFGIKMYINIIINVYESKVEDEKNKFDAKKVD